LPSELANASLTGAGNAPSLHHFGFHNKSFGFQISDAGLVAFSFFMFLRRGVPKGKGKSNFLGIPLFLFLFLAFLLEVPKGTQNLRKIEGKGKAS